MNKNKGKRCPVKEKPFVLTNGPFAAVGFGFPVKESIFG